MPNSRNRLLSATSPYLQQHADNPVDWYPFGDEAFAAARSLDRPILLSIGYSACHWCHVMAHESFEDAETAAFLNERFVSIKVDREELPDVDQIYQRALQLQGESGGWPLTMFLTPAGMPFYGGTYFPPADRYGRPSFRRVLGALSDAWVNKRSAMLEQAQQYRDGLSHVAAQVLDSREHAASSEDLDRAISLLAARADTTHGGFGSAPKFPNVSALRLLARGARRLRARGVADTPLREPFLLQLREMAKGGIYDHAGGGFARYSTDERWLVPHFEKMLYDNAQLLVAYAEGLQHERDPLFERAMRGTAAFIERELRSPAGGLYTALDADSSGVEGRFYVWTWDELAAVLTPDELAFAARAFGVTKEGNWRDPHGHAPPGANVISLVALDEPERREAILGKLFAARALRSRPATDDKVLASTNGLAIAGLAEAGRVLGDQTMIDAATRTADFVLAQLRDAGGRLRRTWKDGDARLPGTLDDHAFVADGLFALYDATGEPRWFDEGVALLRIATTLFWDPEQAAFYLTAAEEQELPPLIERPLSGYDGAIPAGASVLIERLLVVGEALGDDAMVALAERALARRASRALEQPFAYAHLLGALDALLEGPAQIVLTTEHAALTRALADAYLPSRVIVRGDHAPQSLAMLVADKRRAEPAVFVCRRRHCESPESDPQRLRERLTGR